MMWAVVLAGVIGAAVPEGAEAAPVGATVVVAGGKCVAVLEGRVMSLEAAAALMVKRQGPDRAGFAPPSAAASRCWLPMIHAMVASGAKIMFVSEPARPADK